MPVGRETRKGIVGRWLVSRRRSVPSTEAAKAAWRRYRQELYMDKDRQPSAVIEWLHTTTRIRILRVAARESGTPLAGG